MPYTLDNNDMKFATPQGFSTGDEFCDYLRDAFDVLYAEGAEAPEDDVGRPAHAASSGGPGARRRSRGFSTTCSATIASGSAGASTSRATGSTVIRTGRTSAERRPYMPPPPDPTAPPPVQSKVYGCTR